MSPLLIFRRGEGLTPLPFSTRGRGFTPPHYTNLQKYVKLSVVKENVDVCNRRTRDRKLYYDG